MSALLVFSSHIFLFLSLFPRWNLKTALSWEKDWKSRTPVMLRREAQGGSWLHDPQRLLVCCPVPCRPAEESMITSAWFRQGKESHTKFLNNPGVLSYFLTDNQVWCFGNKVSWEPWDSYLLTLLRTLFSIVIAIDSNELPVRTSFIRVCFPLEPSTVVFVLRICTHLYYIL